DLAKRIQEMRREWHEREERFGDRIYDVVEGVPRKKDEQEGGSLLGKRFREVVAGTAKKTFNPDWNTKNLGFDTWIVAIVIALVLFIFLVLR
ncbi:MAG TPA: hypothetical protein VJZ70_06345, partial [Limnochordia bacterium]|nr:hypothetical protein [Limnochordia bacterium]